MNLSRINILPFLLIFLIISLNCCERRYKGGSNYNSSTTNRNPNTPANNLPSQQNRSDQNNDKATVSELFKSLEKSVFQVFATNNFGSGAQGSGFLIGRNIGITNYHVIEKGRDNHYVLINEKFYAISEFLERSRPENLDYIIFRIENYEGNPLKIANKRPEIGEDVFAIGSPRGLNNSLTKGTVSGYRDNNRIQVDATMDHGSSGGALFNMNGEVIGITTSIIGDKELNFAVDIQAILKQNN